MKLKLISFGKISEFIARQEIEITGVNDTDQLRQYLEASFSPLMGMKYKLAINQNIVQSNQPLAENDQVAIMPPFSGG